MEENKDIVGRYIEVKQDIKAKETEMAALELLVLSEHRDDPRIKIVAGRKSITLTEAGYEIIRMLGVTTTVTETRNKKLEEFDVEIQESIVQNPDNVEIKTSKESVRIK